MLYKIKAPRAFRGGCIGNPFNFPEQLAIPLGKAGIAFKALMYLGQYQFINQVLVQGLLIQITPTNQKYLFKI